VSITHWADASKFHRSFILSVGDCKNAFLGRISAVLAKWATKNFLYFNISSKMTSIPPVSENFQKCNFEMLKDYK